MDNTPDHLRQRVVELLGASPPTWNTISGTLYSLYDEAVTHPDDVARNAINDEQSGTLEGWYRFWATASPWHLRLEKVRQIVPRGRDTAVMPDVLVTDRWTWRAKQGIGQFSNGRWQPDRIITNREGKRWVVYDDEIMPDPGTDIDRTASRTLTFFSNRRRCCARSTSPTQSRSYMTIEQASRCGRCQENVKSSIGGLPAWS